MTYQYFEGRTLNPYCLNRILFCNTLKIAYPNKGHLKVAKLVMKKSAEANIDLNAKDKYRQTAFHWACSKGQSKVWLFRVCRFEISDHGTSTLVLLYLHFIVNAILDQF